MRQWVVYKDTRYDLGEVDYLGVSKDNLSKIKDVHLPEGYDGWFPFMSMCYTLGDLGIRSGIFEALKQKYPRIKIALPSKEYITNFFPPQELNNYGYKENKAIDNIDTIWGNNPHIDYYFNKGEFDRIFTDHDRCYTFLIHDGEMVRSCDEPIAEQILRRWGFTDNDFKNINTQPKLYFTPEEIDKGEEIIKNYMGLDSYGCLLFASRIPRYQGRWEYDHHLINETKEFHQKSIFYYSDFDINQTEWGECFPNSLNFKSLKLSIREQLYIKYRAYFNISYQAGITDSVCGGNTISIVLCPYNSIRECCIRGVKYVYKDGNVKQF